MAQSILVIEDDADIRRGLCLLLQARGYVTETAADAITGHSVAVRTRPALRDQVAAALLAARTAGWDRLVAEQRAYLDEFWANGDVELEGDLELQQAVRFALFHLLSAGARAEGRAIPAKGLTGSGYDGHSFWDTDLYVLPVLTYTVPQAAADALRWRHATLPAAKQRAQIFAPAFAEIA